MNCEYDTLIVDFSAGRHASRRRPGSDWRLWKNTFLIACCVLFCGVFLTANVLHAQTFYGSISGIVTDSKGAAVSGASVTVVSKSTAAELKTTTNNAGSYHVSFLKPDTYLVRIEKQGFQEFVVASIPLVMNQPATADAVLHVGKTSQSITVSGAATSLNYTNPQIGGQMGNADLINLPEQISNNGPNEFTMAEVFPGVSGTSSDYSDINNFALGGGRTDNTPIIIDGLPSNMGVDNTYGLTPTPDSTQEMQVLINPFSAQYGQTSGGALLLTSKSGTNDFHGTLFYYHNDQNLDALNYFQVATARLPKNIFNYFGGSVGGPVYIPRLLNGRKRHIYFFVDAEDTLNAQDEFFVTNVPTAAERTGDFSGPTPQGTTQPIIYDPATTTVVNGVVSRTPFPGNVIPPSRLDPVGVNISNFYPLPNCHVNTYNYCSNPPGHTSDLYDTERVDINPTDSDAIMAKFGRDGPYSSAVEWIPNAANNGPVNGWRDDHYEASWSHIVSKRITNELRIGHVSEYNFEYPNTVGVASLGIKNVALTSFPYVGVSGLDSLGGEQFGYTNDGHYVFNDAVTAQIGQQTLSMGGEYMSYTFSQYQPGILSGIYVFTGTFSSLPGTQSTGHADLLLGLPTETVINTNNVVFRQRAKTASLYFEDDYRITKKFTLNLGLRWEFDGPFREVHDRQYTFNPNLVDSTTGLPGGIEFAGVNGAPNTLIARDYKGFAPRFGFSYNIFHNTVLRGGYGIFQLPGIGQGGTNVSNNLVSTNTVQATFVSLNGVTPAYELDNGVPPYSPLVGPNGLPYFPTSLTNPTSSATMLELKSILPYMQEWQFGVQRNLGRKWVAEIDYVGSHGVHMPGSYNLDQIRPGGAYYGESNAQSLRPYPQFTSVNYIHNGGASRYAALMAQLNHSWSNGLTLLTSYTWAKQEDDVEGLSYARNVGIQNEYNIASQWGTAMTDIPQRLTITFVDALPFGAGGKLAAHIPVLDQVIGHWMLSGVGQFQVGYPYNIGQNNTLGLFSDTQFATKVGNPNISRSSRTLQKWFNPAAFQMTPANVLGNAPRAAGFGPGQNVWNLSVMRNFPLPKKTVFQIRLDGYNAFNHPQFSGLQTGISNVAFGSITSAHDQRVVQVDGRITF